MSNEIVKYSNQFNAQALRKFTALDLDLLMAIAARVRDQEIDEVTFTFEELRRLAHVKKNLTDKELAARIVEVNDRLLACRFKFQDDSRTVQFTLFSGFETDWKTRKLLIAVNPRFSFLLNDLTSQFTRFELAEFTALKSSYAKETYRRLKQYRQTGVWKVSIEEFRRLLDVPESYQTCDLNKRVLKPIQDELGPLLNLVVHKKFRKGAGRGRRSLAGFEFEFDPEKVPGGAPAPRVELSGSVVTDEARKSLRDVSKTPVPDLSVPGEGPALDPDTQAFLDAHPCRDGHQQIKIERGELAAERARAELDAYKAAHDGLTPFEVARRSHDSQAMPDDRMEPGIEPTLF